MQGMDILPFLIKIRPNNSNIHHKHCCRSWETNAEFGLLAVPHMNLMTVRDRVQFTWETQSVKLSATLQACLNISI